MTTIDFEKNISNCRLLSLWSTAALVLVLILGWVVQGAETSDIASLGVQLLPLFFFWPGLAKGKTRSYFWLCTLLMLYAVKAIVEVVATPLYVLAWLELVVVTSLFFATYYYIRWIMRQKKAAAPKPDTAA